MTNGVKFYTHGVLNKKKYDDYLVDGYTPASGYFLFIIERARMFLI